MDLSFGRDNICPLHRHSNMVSRQFYKRILRSRRRSFSFSEWDGNCCRLDVCSIFYFDGWFDFFYGVWRFCLSHGVDRRLRSFGTFISALSQEIWQVYSTRFYRGAVLFKNSKNCCSALRTISLFYLCRWTNERSRGCFCSFPWGGYQYRGDHRNDHRFILCCVRGNERDYLYPGRTVLCLDFCLYGTSHFYLYTNDRKPYSTIGDGLKGRGWCLFITKIKRIIDRARFCRLYQWDKIYFRCLCYNGSFNGWNCRAAACYCSFFYG